MFTPKNATLAASIVLVSFIQLAFCTAQDTTTHQSQSKFETESKAEEYPGPRCLGPFCLDRTVTTRSLFARLGPPAPRSSRFDPYCYGSATGDAFLYLDTPDSQPGEIVTLSLADFPNCAHLRVKGTNDDIRAWKTTEGIGLGSLEAVVVRAYGKRYSKENIVAGDERTLVSTIRGYRHGDKPTEIGQTVIRYRGAWDDLRTAEFCIRDGKVSCLYLSRNE
jgi:hypothetical protein